MNDLLDIEQLEELVNLKNMNEDNIIKKSEKECLESFKKNYIKTGTFSKDLAECNGYLKNVNDIDTLKRKYPQIIFKKEEVYSYQIKSEHYGIHCPSSKNKN